MAEANVLSLFVQDMAAALAFYRLLGLDFPPGAEGDQHVEATLSGGFRLAFDDLAVVKAMYPDMMSPQGHRASLAFPCDSAAALDALYAKLTAAGYGSRRTPWDAFWGQRNAAVLDPDGNWIALFAPLATA